MNRSDLIAHVRNQTLASTGEQSDAVIGDLLDQALLELATFAQWPWLFATDTIELLDSVSTYDLPADLMFLRELVYDGQGRSPLTRTSVEEVKAVYGDEVGTSGLPHLWYPTTPLSVTFVPTPDDAATVNVTYYKTPDLTEFDEVTDEPPFHAAFHIILAEHAMQSFWEREEQFQLASTYEQRYYRRAASMLQFYTSNIQPEPLIVGSGDHLTLHRRVPAWWTEA